MNLKIAAFLALAAAQAVVEESNLVMGIGKGTLAVVIFAIIGIVICFFKDGSYFPNLVVTCGCFLPLLVLLIIWSWPKQDPAATAAEKAKKEPTDIFMVRTIIFLVFVSLMCCCSLIGLLSINMRTVQVRRMDSEVGI